MRLIDADALEELFREVIGNIAKKPEMNGNLEHMVRASAMVIEMIKDAPTIEPEPRKGKWVKLYAGNYKCTECGDWWSSDDNEIVADFKFCPNCGADMRDTDD